VLGKSGSELGDVLLEMSEKGLGSFIEKAKALGLNLDADAIQKYKQSVEEMKLSWEAIEIFVGNQLLPAFQAVTEWLTTKLQDPRIKQSIDTIAGWFKNGIDWQEVGDFLQKGIGSIDWAKVGEVTAKGVGVIIHEVARFLKEFDWWGLGNSLASAFNNLWAGMLGGTEATMQFRIKTAINKITQDIENWLNKANAYLAGLGIGGSKMKIIDLPSFDMSSPAPSSGTSTGTVQAGNYTYNPATGTYTLNSNRASGGPVIAGQSYNVSEFFQPERFTPNTSGRIDRISDQQNVTVRFDEDRLVRVLKSVLQQG
jgi:hypothetical protein